MCTVSFVPLTKNEFILTSNRDEATARGLASAPKILEKQKYRLVCPVDPLASGTWIAASDRVEVICLLNGAFKKHHHQPPYRKSRGLVVMDYFDVADPEIFAAEYELAGIEPFTMVLLKGGSALQLFELRWDGAEKFFKPLDPAQVHLWSSVTLYRNEVAEAKKNLFVEMLKEKGSFENLKPADLISIHRQFLYEDWVKPPERVEVVSTLSITSIESGNEELKMHYLDLVRKELEVVSLAL